MVKLHCPYLHSFGHAPRPPAFCIVLICPARPVWYRVQTGAACPASGRVCRSLHGLCLHLARRALLPVMCRPSGCAGGWGLHRRGIQGAPVVGWVMPAIKFFKEKGVFGVPLANTHPTFTNQNPSDCASLQKFRKIQKGPSSGLICAILDRKKGAL